MTEPGMVACIQQGPNGSGAGRAWRRCRNENAWVHRDPQAGGQSTGDLLSAQAHFECLSSGEDSELPRRNLGQRRLGRLLCRLEFRNCRAVHANQARPFRSCAVPPASLWGKVNALVAPVDSAAAIPCCREDRRASACRLLSAGNTHGDLHDSGGYAERQRRVRGMDGCEYAEPAGGDVDPAAVRGTGRRCRSLMLRRVCEAEFGCALTVQDKRSG